MEVDLLESFAAQCNFVPELSNTNYNNENLNISDEILYFKSAVNKKKQ